MHVLGVGVPVAEPGQVRPVVVVDDGPLVLVPLPGRGPLWAAVDGHVEDADGQLVLGLDVTDELAGLFENVLDLLRFRRHKRLHERRLVPGVEKVDPVVHQVDAALAVSVPRRHHVLVPDGVVGLDAGKVDEFGHQTVPVLFNLRRVVAHLGVKVDDHAARALGDAVVERRADVVLGLFDKLLHDDGVSGNAVPVWHLRVGIRVLVVGLADGETLGVLKLVGLGLEVGGILGLLAKADGDVRRENHLGLLDRAENDDILVYARV